MTAKLTKYAKRLRRNSTQAEALMWSRLRARQMEAVKFRRQQQIENFIVDFVSFEKRIVIELDGGQHAKNKDKDNERDRLLTENGFTVLRFWDNEVFENFHPPLTPPVKGGKKVSAYTHPCHNYGIFDKGEGL